MATSGYRNPDCAEMVVAFPSGKRQNRSRCIPGSGKEEIVRFCREVLQGQHFDYFIFGHRHLPIDYTLSPSSRYINTGDWITYYSFASFDGREVVLETEDKNQDFHFDLL